MINYTQLVVKIDKTIIAMLEQNGYDNPHRLPDNYTFSAFIVDIPSKSIFGTNATCMAASASSGNKPIVLDAKQVTEKLGIL